MDVRVNAPCRKPSLRGVLARYFVATLALCALCFVVWFVALILLVNARLFLPASSAETATLQTIAILQEGGSLTPQQYPALCRWAVIENDAVTGTNLSPRAAQTALSIWQNSGALLLTGNYITRRPLLGYIQYYRACTLPGSAQTVVLFQYDFCMQYADPALQAALPDGQTLLLVVLVVLLLASVILSTRHTARFLAAEAARLSAAAEGIRQQQLPTLQLEGAQVREFDEALHAMQLLSSHLTSSLQNQWAAEQQRGEQIAALTHDLKTPLTIIRGNAELLCEDGLPPAQQQSAQAILHAADRADTFVAALRNANRTEQAAPEAPAPLLLTEFLQQRAATGQALCALHHSEFVLQNEIGEPLTFTAQKQALSRAVDNLLDNAARHTPVGGRVTLQCRREGALLCFAVRDTGPGFSPQALQKAGQLLYRGDAARSGGEHQGLGLFVAHSIAAAHGGSLTVQNNHPAPGAEVTIQIKI